MGDEKDAFYVVRKGDVIGVYKSLSDLQALIRSCVSFLARQMIFAYVWNVFKF